MRVRGNKTESSKLIQLGEIRIANFKVWGLEMFPGRCCCRCSRKVSGPLTNPSTLGKEKKKEGNNGFEDLETLCRSPELGLELNAQNGYLARVCRDIEFEVWHHVEL